MRLSYKWMQEYVDLTGITPHQLADKLTAAGLEVEGIEPLAQGTNLVIGKVLSCENHPDSDHLHVCQVDIGTETTQIVCGAPNVAAGQTVIVAQVGAVLPQITIKAGVIRGVSSNGMICSLLELGVDEKQLSDAQKEGIEVLPDHAVAGDANPLAYLGLDDVILDIGLTPNRKDCLSMFALANEIGAILNRPSVLPKMKFAGDVLPSALKVGSETEQCKLFLGKVIGEVTVKPSPSWLKERLHAAGIKAINNVVDISNYVMLETGQPLHFYDAAKIHNQEITVKAGIETNYRALDGEEYAILPEDIMITTGGVCSGIAGIMGGDDSKIDESTTSIIIEAAHFHSVSVRNTARRLGINSEAATRFQKGIEPLAAYTAMERATILLEELADAKQLEETVVCNEMPYTPTVITVSLEFINRRLGTQFALEEVADVLKRLQCNPQVDGTSIQVTIPSYRTDLAIQDDISEEIIRILGYDRLQATLPETEMTLGSLNPKQQKRRLIEQILMDSGLQQVITYTLIGEQLKNHAVLPLGETIALASPMSEERKYIRSSLLPSMLDTVSYNIAHFQSDVAVFEISNVYAKGLVNERLGLVMTGKLQGLDWKKLHIGSDFYTIKGIIETLLERLGFDSSRIFVKENTVDTIHFHPKQSAAIYLGRDLLGVFGMMHPLMKKAYDMKQGVMAELNLDLLYQAKASKIKFAPIPKYPAIKRDLAVVVDKHIEARQLVDLIKKTSKALIKDVQLFDVYEGEHVGEQEKSVALSILYHSMEKTLTEQDIASVHEQILVVLKKELNAVLRG